MADKEWAPATILDVFGDSIARATLVLASEGPVTVPDVAETLDVSTPTVYRRVAPLVEANLLRERQGIDADGNQPCTYETMLDEVTFEVDAGGYTVDVSFRQDLADDFHALWADLDGTGWRIDRSTSLEQSNPSERGVDPS